MVVLFFLRGPWIKFLISWWFGLVVWIPGIPLWKGSLLGGTPTIPNHQPKPPNYYILLDWISVTYCWTCSLRTRQVCCQAIWGFSDRWVRAPRPWPSLLAWTIQPVDIIPMKELSHRKRWCEKFRGFSQPFLHESSGHGTLQWWHFGRYDGVILTVSRFVSLFGWGHCLTALPFRYGWGGCQCRCCEGPHVILRCIWGWFLRGPPFEGYRHFPCEIYVLGFIYSF